MKSGHALPRRLAAAILAALASAALAADPAGAVRTICTATVNSSDEARVLAARLPAGRFRVVELVQPGRADWLAAACAAELRCDALVVSGHFNAGDAFYAAAYDRTERLDVDALERAACSGSCPALFSRLRAVYLLGCESLNPDASRFASADGDSGLARMRRIFAGVPSIYGFDGPAPAGPLAASVLERYLDAGGAARFGQGGADGLLLRSFSSLGMVRAEGLDPASKDRGLACRFYDERTTAAQKLAFVHELLRRDGAAQRRRIARFLDGLSARDRADPAVVEALARLRADAATRERFLAESRAAPLPSERARRLELATSLGWLAGPERAEAVLAFARDMAARPGAGEEEVGLACSLARGETFAADAMPAGDGAAPAAIRACLGDIAARQETLLLLAGADERGVRIARAYLRHRPELAASEVRALARAVAEMPAGVAKVRALETLARLPVRDREALGVLEWLFAITRSAEVQEAVAEVFLRAGHHPPSLASLVAAHRIAPPHRAPVVEALCAVLRASS